MRTLLIAFAGLAAGFGIPRLDETKAPPLRLELQIDGKVYKLLEGKKSSIEIDGKQRDVVVRGVPTRVFAAAGMTFEYPAEMSFELEDDEDLGLQSWTLDGEDTTVLVYQFGDGSPTDMARQMLQGSVDAFENGKIEEIQLSIGGRKQKAFKGSVPLAGDRMTFFTFGAIRKDRCCVVMIQDTGDGDDIADETKEMLRRLDETFRLRK